MSLSAWEAEVLVDKFLFGGDEAKPSLQVLRRSPDAAVVALTKKLHPSNDNLVETAVLLGEFGSKSAPAIPALISMLDSSEEGGAIDNGPVTAGEVAAFTLARIGRTAIPALVESLRHGSGGARASLALGLMGRDAVEAIPDLRCFSIIQRDALLRYSP